MSLWPAKCTLELKGWGGLERFVNEHKYCKSVQLRNPAAPCATSLGKPAVQAVLGLSYLYFISLSENRQNNLLFLNVRFVYGK